MTRPVDPKINDCIGEEGHTLVESIVAVALLVTVMVPLIGGLAIILGHSRTGDTTTALLLARSALEDAFYLPLTTDSTWTHDRWTIRRTVTAVDSVLVLRVDVSRKDTRRTPSAPLVSIKTLWSHPLLPPSAPVRGQFKSSLLP